jgi:hypothetical protein
LERMGKFCLSPPWAGELISHTLIKDLAKRSAEFLAIICSQCSLGTFLAPRKVRQILQEKYGK